MSDVPEEFEQEFVPGIAARLPRKRVAAGALVRDDDGRVLFVEPVYKPTWDLPGGVVEADESPLDGCRRELAEELGEEVGAAICVSRLLVVDWVPRRGPWHDALLFVFDGGLLAAGALDQLRLPPDELRAVRFTRPDDAAAHLPPDLLRRVRVAVEVADDPTNGPRYLQQGLPAE